MAATFEVSSADAAQGKNPHSGKSCLASIEVPNPAATLGELITNAARLWSDSLALDIAGDTLTFAELNRKTSELAVGLAGLGIAKGDRVCAVLDTSIDQLCLWFAVGRLGAIWVPINTAFRGEFLRHQIADAAPAAIVIDVDYRERIEEVRADTGCNPILILRGSASDGDDAGSVELASLHLASVGFTDTPVNPADPAMLLYTSGTTGPSKGCIISHNYICNVGRQMGEFSRLTRNDVYWAPLPFFHMGGCSTIMTGLVHGCTVASVPRFSVTNFWPEVERSGATVVLLLSTMLNFIADAPDTEGSKRCHGKVRTLIGNPVPKPVQTLWKERFGVRHASALGYGMTECTTMVMRHMDLDFPAESSGATFGEFDVRIVDDEDRECPPDTPGEIVVRPLYPNIMFSGYWQRPEATVEAFRNLWFHTGDIGRICKDGYFYFVDRKKDYLRRGGENISSFEMETAFRAHPDIADVAVHAIPSEHAEDEVKVSAILTDDATVTEADLWRWAETRVPAFALPRYIEFRSDFPRNAVGRVLKFELRTEGVNEGCWDREQDLELRRKSRRPRQAGTSPA